MGKQKNRRNKKRIQNDRASAEKLSIILRRCSLKEGKKQKGYKTKGR